MDGKNEIAKRKGGGMGEYWDFSQGKLGGGAVTGGKKQQ